MYGCVWCVCLWIISQRQQSKQKPYRNQFQYCVIKTHHNNCVFFCVLVINIKKIKDITVADYKGHFCNNHDFEVERKFFIQSGKVFCGFNDCLMFYLILRKGALMEWQTDITWIPLMGQNQLQIKWMFFWLSTSFLFCLGNLFLLFYPFIFSKSIHFYINFHFLGMAITF